VRRVLPWLAAGLGLAAVVAGVVVFVLAAQAPVGDFGWSAYAPLEEVDDAFDSSLVLSFEDRWTVLWTGGHLLGAGLVVAGLLVLAALGGWLFGRRRAAR
jgi:hypothetical protein